MNIEAMKMAAEALESSQQYVQASADAKLKPGWGEQLDRADSAINALRQAIAQAEPAQPVAHVPADALERMKPPMLILRNVPLYSYGAEGTVAVYTAPPAQKPLTTEQFTDIAHRIASKYTHRSVGTVTSYTFLPHTLEQFVREIEAARNIK